MYLQKVKAQFGAEGKYVVAEDKKPIERTVEVTLTLAEAAKALGHKDWCKVNDYLDADTMDDVFHNGYSERDVLSFSVKGMDDVEKIFPLCVAIGAEDAEREAYAAAIGEARRDALVATLEAVQVSAEYMTGDGEMISLKGKAGIKSATIDDDKIKVVIENPEHLINDIVNGVGYFAPPLDPYEKASDAEIKSYLIANIDEFFDVYGERKPDGQLSSQFSPDINDAYMAEQVEYRCSELSIDEVAQAVIDAVEEDRLEKDEAIDLAAKYSGSSKADIKKTIKEILGSKLKRFEDA